MKIPPYSSRMPRKPRLYTLARGQLIAVGVALVGALVACEGDEKSAVPGAAGQGLSGGGALGSSAGTTNFGGNSNQAGMSNPPTAGRAGSASTAGEGGTATAGAGGTGGVGGAGGVGGSGGQAAAGSGSCVTAGSELCEDFESGALDLAKWKLNKPTASAVVAVDDTRPHAGKYALHVKLVPDQSSTAQIADAVTFPALSNTFYTRAFFYFSPDLPADNNGGFHMAFLLATGNNDLGFVEAGLGSAGDKQYLGYSEYYGAGPDKHEHGPTFTEFGPRSNTRVAPLKWLCLELMQGGDATTTTRRVWVDGQELPEQKNSFSDRKPPAFSLVSIGVLQYHPTPLLSDVWVDDIRVSKDPIGCEK